MPRDTLETNLIWNRLRTSTEEMYEVASKLAFSSSIRDRADNASSICTTGGETIGSSKRSTPVLSGANRSVVRTVLTEHYPPETLSPGDSIVTNDPWFVGGHPSDVAVINPIFADSELLCLASSIGHLADIGGNVGGWSIGARDVYEEGIRIPPTKLYEEDAINRDIKEFIRANVRLPDKVMGDIEALRSANTFGEERIREMVDEFGTDSFARATTDITALSIDRLRNYIATVDDGTYRSSGTWTVSRGSEPDISFRVGLEVEVRDRTIAFDFSGTSDQVRVGINCPSGNLRGMISYIVKSMVLSESERAESVDEVFELSIPDGSIINPRRPAPTSGRHITLFPASYCVINALGKAIPKEAMAWPSGGQRIVIDGTDESGAEFLGVNSAISPWPARGGKDGIDCQAFPTNVKNLPIELMELYTPLRVLSNNLVPDTEGAGRFRSGFAQELVLQNPTTDRFDVSLTSGADDRPQGVAGGEAGCSARVESRTREQELPLNGSFSFPPGEVIRLRSPSGGGFGPPEERSVELLERDVASELITRTRAEAVYEYERSDE